MDAMSESRAISAAKAFATERGLGFEEPIVAELLGDGHYQVMLPVEGASDPSLVIDPPELIIQVDLEEDQITLISAM